MTDKIGRTVLVVDDDEDIVSLVSFVLEEQGYVVVTAADGTAALGALETGSPGLILLDLRMPGMNGWEFATQARRQYGSQVAIVVMTAGDDGVRSAKEIQADGSLSKPFDIDDLVITVRKYGRFSDVDLQNVTSA